MDAIEKKIVDLIDAHRREILEFAEDIAAHPEPGFEEVRTAARVEKFLGEAWLRGSDAACSHRCPGVTRGERAVPM